METAPKKPVQEPVLAGVIGWPVAHSLSPLIHTVWARRAGIEGYYLPLAVPADYNTFARTMDSLKKIGFAGVNVTIPHKEHAYRYADEADEGAAKAGAANMLTFTASGVKAENSDIIGFQKAIEEQGGIKGSRAVLLGAGGAARAVVLALQKLGAAEIIVANRTAAKAKELAEQAGVQSIEWEKRNDALAGANVVVNATSLGMAGQPPLEINPDETATDAIVADIVYSPLQTPLLAAATKAGRRTVDGLSMLMHQAAPGFRAWFGGEASVDSALRKELIDELSIRTKA